MKSFSININDSNIFYTKHGDGNTALFLHGMPVSSYIWRNITPSLANDFECISLDLIGMGKSDKPNISYSIKEHVDYLDKFINKLNLKNINLVLHGFGSIIGLEYASKNKNNINSIVFYESHLTSIKLSRLSLPLQQMVYNLKSINNLEKSLLETNLLLDLFLNNGVLKKLPKAIVNNYYSYYKEPSERRIFLKYINSILNFDSQNEINNAIDNYSDFLITSNIPKCLLYSTPGMLATFEIISWAKNNIKNLTIENVGYGLHFAQETVPYEFANKLSNWYKNKL